MGEKTMYETIMNLPLFHGVGPDHVSAFLEKTSIAFHKYSDGEVVVKKGEGVKTLKFLLSGKIRVAHDVLAGEVRIFSDFEGHEAIAATHLFGMHPHYESTITAVGDVSLMEFSKEKYVGLLRSDEIYLMNFANLLSHNIQKTTHVIPFFRRLDLSRAIAEWLVMFTARKSTNIYIDGVASLEDIYGKSYVEDSLERLTSMNLAEVGGNKITVIDREGIIDYATTI